MTDAVDPGWEAIEHLRDAAILLEELEGISEVYRDRFLLLFKEAGWDPVKMRQAIIRGADIPQEYCPVGVGMSFDPYYDEQGRPRM